MHTIIYIIIHVSRYSHYSKGIAYLCRARLAAYAARPVLATFARRRPVHVCETLIAVIRQRANS